MENTFHENEQKKSAFAELLDNYLRGDVREGEIVKGKVIKVDDENVLIDIGYKSEGLISVKEFMDAEGNINVKEGDSVLVYVETVENEDGRVELSKEKANKLKIWDDIINAYEKDGVIEGVVISKVKGGLSVDIGVKAFLPGSQIDLRTTRNLDQYIGKKFQFKVLKFNKRRGNIVLSRRALLEKQREEKKKRTLQSLQAGQIIRGVIKNITDYGCFVDLGGIDGLLHITDMSWGRITHPSEIFKVGEEVEVKIIKFDPNSERVSLGYKQIKEPPWSKIEEKYHIGDRVKGKVVSMTDYGAFVEIEEGIEGLVHISDMSWTKKITHPLQFLNLNDEVEAVILEIDKSVKKLTLGIKQAEVNPWYLLKEKYPVGTKVKGTIKNITHFGVFIEVGEGIDGLVYLQDLTWSHKIKHPKELYRKGDEVEALVLQIDPEKEKFLLGIKQLTPDPWEIVHDKYPIGSIVEGKVIKILDFGAIVELSDEIEGLVHISEIRTEKVDNIKKVLKEGETVKAMIINLIPEERKIGLSIRRVQEAEESGIYDEYANAQKFTPTTIGDLIKEKIDTSRFPKSVTEGEKETVKLVEEVHPISEEEIKEVVDEEGEKKKEKKVVKRGRKKKTLKPVEEETEEEKKE